MSDFIDGLVNGIKDATFTLPDDIFSINGVAEKYDTVSKISKTFSIIALILCMIGILYSLDIFSSAKLRLKFNEFMLSIFLIFVGKYLINEFNHLANLFVNLWLPSNIGGENGLSGAILASMGVATATGTLEVLGFALLFLLGILVLFLLLMMLTHSIILGLLQIVIILFPLIMSIYPLSIGKKLMSGIGALYGALLAIAPLQALVINLFIGSLQKAANPTVANICNALGMLIIAVFIIPGSLIFVLTKASSPKLS
jgi:hypothetical protein